jgi:hypothetical protein
MTVVEPKALEPALQGAMWDSGSGNQSSRKCGNLGDIVFLGALGRVFRLRSSHISQVKM